MTPPARDNWTERLGAWLAFALPALLAVRLGLLAHGRALVDLDAQAAAYRAWQVFHLQDHANLALIGFAQPPLHALLYVPLAAFAPRLLVSGLAAPLVGALFLGLAVLMLWRFGRSLGLPAWLLVLVAAAFTLHPLVLGYATLGSRAMVLIFLMLGLSCSLVDWVRTQRVRDIVTGGLFAAAVVLLAYATVLVVLAAALCLAWYCRRSEDEAPARAEGTLIAFLLPTLYVAAVWVLADWIIMGQFLGFWRAAMGHAAFTPLPGRELLTVVLGLLVITNPLLLAISYVQLRPGSGQRSGVPAFAMLLTALLAPTVFPTLRPGAGQTTWVALLPVAATVAGVGVTLLLVFLAEVREAGTNWRRVLSPGFVVVALGGLALAWSLQTSGQGLPTGLRGTLRGRPAFAREVGDEWRVAARLGASLRPGKHHVIGGPEAFVIGLRSEVRDRTHVASDAGVPESPWVRQLEAGSWLVLDDREGRRAADWQRMLPPYLGVKPRWRQGVWRAYELAVRPVLAPASGGQSPAGGAIIAPQGATVAPAGSH